MHGVIVNFPVRWAQIALHLILKPMGMQRYKPKDSLGRKLARLLTEPNDARTRLTRLAYSVSGEYCPVGRMEEVFHQVCAVEELERKVLKAAKEKRFKSLGFSDLIDEALSAEILTAAEAKQLAQAEMGRQAVIKVDDFADEELRRPKPKSHSGREHHVRATDKDVL